MLATQDTRIRCQRRNRMFDDLVLIGQIWIPIPDVGVVTACEPDTNHDVCHEGTLAAAVLMCHGPTVPALDMRPRSQLTTAVSDRLS